MDYRKINPSEVNALWDLQKQYKAEIGEDEPSDDGKERGTRHLFARGVSAHAALRPARALRSKLGIPASHVNGGNERNDGRGKQYARQGQQEDAGSHGMPFVGVTGRRR